MKIAGYDFDIGKANEELARLEAKKVMLQVPDGLRRRTYQITSELDAEVTVWGGTCYGACDLPLDIGDNDALVHFGHTCLPDIEYDYDVVYVEGRSSASLKIPKELSEITEGKIALYSTVQYLELRKEVGNILEDDGYSTIVGEGDPRIKYPGQLLGCNFSAGVEKADTHIYVGTGMFHALGLSLSLKKDVAILNPVTGELNSTKKTADRMLRKRFAAIEGIKEAERIGMIVSIKPGQRRMEIAEKLCESCEGRCTLLEFDEVEPELVDSFGWKGMVNTACPRLALDDFVRFDTTMVTPIELSIALGELEWDDWKVDEIKGKL